MERKVALCQGQGDGELFMALGEAFDPKFQHYRSMETRINILVTCVDDVYDAYSTSNYSPIWDANVAEQLPDYMKICFLGLFNSINEMAYCTLNEHGVHILPYLKKKVFIPFV
ncbi:hypothetical protein HYC85_025560 [Camellia sinensis]|uniref:Terpene synthase metal-binding domain-containing protein n=1 Tax=Camellia sinensis TaxID=4442 RepID=A0A7J7GF76_CAMSI|nr:hypothetical protein HYC85_025560 [Camellia sinensis]